MKQLVIIWVLILSAGSLRAEVEQPKQVDNKIDKVTVFLSGAQIHRTGGFYLQPGVTELAFDGVSPYLDANTLQAKGIGEFTIMDVSFQTYYPKPDNVLPNQNEIPADIRNKMSRLRDSLSGVTYDIEELTAMREVYTMERQMLLNNGTVKGTGKVNDSIPLLKDAMAFFHQKMTEINLQLFKTKKQLDALTEKKTGMESRYRDLENWRNHNNLVNNVALGPIYRVVVTASCEKAVRGSLEIAYIVSQAGWKPSYDLRAKDANSDIELNYKAEVYQSTGNDWDKIPLTLSTANPYDNQQKPVLSTWYIGYYNPQYYRDKAEEYEEKSKKVAEARTDDGSGLTSIQGYLSLDANTAVAHTQMIENMVTAEYRINLPYSIKSNNKAHMVAVSQKNLKADYSLALVPKLDRNAFLIANIVDWDDLNLVPAQARIYYDGTFVGTSYLDPMAMEDTLKIAMGRDNNVSANRKKLKDKTREKVIGDSKIKETYYEITIKNTHGYPVELFVEDQVPVSNVSDIKVEVLETDKASLNELTGMLTWRFKVKPGGTEKVGFGYSIKYDKSKNLSMAF